MREAGFNRAGVLRELLTKRKITAHHVVGGLVHASLGVGAIHVDALQQASKGSPWHYQY